MKKEAIFTGSGVAIVTPMDRTGRINYKVFKQLIEFQIANGSDAIVVCGTTGEASTMGDEEHVQMIDYCAEVVDGRVPVIAGTGSNDTQYAVMLSKEAAVRGVDALLQVTPYYNKANEKGLIRHFTTIADQAKTPVILYNVPSRTGMSISIKTYQELAEHPLIVATKEASGDISHIAQLAAACGDTLDIYSGNDDQTLPILALGGAGVISVMANVAPQAMHNICQLYFDGKIKESLALQLEYMALHNALFCDVNPIPVKQAVSYLGYDAGPCRLPLGPLSDDDQEWLHEEMKARDLI